MEYLAGRGAGGGFSSPLAVRGAEGDAPLVWVPPGQLGDVVRRLAGAVATASEGITGQN
jgi:hypothetical protein